MSNIGFMNYVKNFNSISMNPVDNTVQLIKYFSNIFFPYFGYFSTSHRIIRNRFNDLNYS